jgi:hypothetical protein
LGQCFNQKKRTVNFLIGQLLCSGVTQRRTARIAAVNRKTVERKLLILARQARKERLEYLQFLQSQPQRLTALEFDEMESFERSKYLPLSLPLVVVPETRKILGIAVASMPGKGLLAEFSRKKYGRRKDERAAIASQLLAEIKSACAPKLTIVTDQNPQYPRWLRAHFPDVKHQTTRGKRGRTVGQGELKKTLFDPLFSLNHTAAMLRANVSRLVRRTWATTKRPDRLHAHLELYIRYHNQCLTPGYPNAA